MSRIDLVPFDDIHLPAAGALLAQRHQRDREARPELPSRFEDPEVARRAVEAAWRRPWASGVAAFVEDRLIGYLFGDLEVADAARGRSATVRLAGHAVARDVDADVFRDLYVAAATRWLTAGCFEHYILTSAADRAELDAWFTLSFGQDHVWGLRPLTDVDLSKDGGAGELTIRRAEPADREALAECSPLIARHHARAPIWTPVGPEAFADLRAGYAKVADDPAVTVWLAFRGDRPVGFQVYFPMPSADDGLIVPDSCVELKVAATAENERGRGVGRLLTRRGLAAARAQGYDWCDVDWRTGNLLASRFWPRQGFQPVAYRLRRMIDARIAWANGE